ncbi:hypothetical protein CYMTET_22911 [Cymbomonas tetramitiformis]|uniref:Uncharacterized protein n=1 Tax=Cymbomonas tetramitiformis TaxID=36881 RepID=A0AAE0L1T8_9CHLO|nr:hypothetical protein CYMTET_22911 [Cymbomonas tetramitiformis]
MKNRQAAQLQQTSLITTMSGQLASLSAEVAANKIAVSEASASGSSATKKKDAEAEIARRKLLPQQRMPKKVEPAVELDVVVAVVAVVTRRSKVPLEERAQVKVAARKPGRMPENVRGALLFGSNTICKHGWTRRSSTLGTEASGRACNGHTCPEILNKEASGFWPDELRHLHITHLELEAIFKTVQSFMNELEGKVARYIRDEANESDPPSKCEDIDDWRLDRQWFEWADNH